MEHSPAEQSRIDAFWRRFTDGKAQLQAAGVTEEQIMARAIELLDAATGPAKIKSKKS